MDEGWIVLFTEMYLPYPKLLYLIVLWLRSEGQAEAFFKVCSATNFTPEEASRFQNSTIASFIMRDISVCCTAVCMDR